MLESNERQVAFGLGRHITVALTACLLTAATGGGCGAKKQVTPVELGNKSLDEGRFEDAIAEFTVEIRAHPKNLSALGNRAVAYAKIGRSQEAIADLTLLIASWPDNLIARSQRAELFTLRQEYDKAVEDWTFVIEKLSPAVGDPQVQRGILYRKMGQIDKAIDDFESALKGPKTRPKTLACANLGVLRLCLGQWQKAHDAFQKRLELVPGDPQAALFQYIAGRLAGESDSSRLLEAVTNSVADKQILTQAIDLFLGKCGPDAVIAAAGTNETTELSKQHDAHFFVGCYFMTLGDKAQAKTNFSMCLRPSGAESIGAFCAPFILQQLDPSNPPPARITE